VSRPVRVRGIVSVYEKLLQLEGVLKDVYRELGGAERAIREERDGYSRSSLVDCDTGDPEFRTPH